MSPRSSPGKAAHALRNLPPMTCMVSSPLSVSIFTFGERKYCRPHQPSDSTESHDLSLGRGDILGPGAGSGGRQTRADQGREEDQASWVPPQGCPGSEGRARAHGCPCAHACGGCVRWSELRIHDNLTETCRLCQALGAEPVLLTMPLPEELAGSCLGAPGGGPPLRVDEILTQPSPLSAQHQGQSRAVGGAQ